MPGTVQTGHACMMTITLEARDAGVWECRLRLRDGRRITQTTNFGSHVPTATSSASSVGAAGEAEEGKGV